MAWYFDGTAISLSSNEYMYGVTEPESIYDAPAVRGNNVIIPLREGSLHVEKVFGERPITLGFLVRGVSLEDFENKIDTLHKLFAKRNQKVLKYARANGAVRTIQAEVIPPFNYKKDSEFSARATIDFICNEPFFRGTALRSFTAVASAAPGGDTTFNVVNRGTVPDKTAQIEFVGPMYNPRITNNENDVWIGINGSVAAGTSVHVDVKEFSASPSSRNGDIEHSGDAYFMVINPGTSEMQLSNDISGGSAIIQFYDPYL